jgi:hypothetical protein
MDATHGAKRKTGEIKMADTSHLVAIQQRLASERERLANATTEAEKQQRAVWVAQVEREEVAELEFLGMTGEPLPEMSDDDLLAALLA